MTLDESIKYVDKVNVRLLNHLGFRKTRLNTADKSQIIHTSYIFYLQPFDSAFIFVDKLIKKCIN